MKQLGGFFHTLSRGQALAPAIALKTNGNNAPLKTKNLLVPSLCGGMRV